MSTKVCNKCHREKAVGDFGVHRLIKDGLQNTCRLCKSKLDKEYRDRTQYDRENYVRINAKNRRARYGYQIAWKQYFAERYGTNPECQICCKSLRFDKKGKEVAVHFDHRHGGDELIKSTPASWYTERPCTQEHRDTFESCDFGILCSACNQMLPTVNRDEWLQKVIEYHEATASNLAR